MIQRLFASAAVAALGAAIALPAQAADSASQVQEVVVTAMKRAENVQNVPISMEVVSSEKLEAFHADTFKAISIPNMNVGAVGGNDVIYIRGFGSPSQNYAFDQSVSLYVDGVYAGKSRQFMAPFFDLQRVEVLRGPQGALFGKNTAAGAISVISAQPTSTFSGGATGIYNFNLKGPEVSGYVSGPLSEKLSARLAARIVDQDGYIKNLVPGGQKETTNQSQLARLILKYVDTNFDFTAKAEYGHVKSEGNGSVAGPVTTEQQPRLTRYAAEDPQLGPAGFGTTSWNLAGTGNLQLGEFTLTSVSGYSTFDATHVNNFDQTIPTGGVTPATIFNSFPEHYQQWSEELRLQSPTGGKFDYIIGAYYDNSQYRVESFNHNIIPGLGNFLSRTFFKQQAESSSLFGQGTYHFTDAFRALGSLRYSHTVKRGAFNSYLLQGPFPLRPITQAPNGHIDEGNVDPSLTLQYDLAPRTMVYVSYGQGSKSGGFVSNTAGTTNATFEFEPEHSKNIELGLKTTLDDGKLVLNTAVYKIKFDNLQVSTYNPNVQQFIVGNAAEASGTGIEAAANWYPLPGLDISASGAYQDVKYDDFPGAQCLASQPVSACNPLSPASVAANNLAGAPLPNISKFSGSFQVHYVAELPQNLRLGTTVAVSGRSKFFNSDDESTLYGVQDGYAKVDARIELYPEGSRWTLALVGTNLTNELTTSGSFRLPTPVTTVTRALYWVDPPRNISIEARVNF